MEGPCCVRVARVVRVLALAVSWCACVSTFAATITVNSTADTVANDGACTLREAIIAANTDTASGGAAGECAAGSGADTIAFNIPGSGVHTITITGLFPSITSPVTVDGYTQPGSSPNTNAFPAALNTVLRIEVTPGEFDLGSGASGTVIRGLILNGGSDEINVNPGVDNLTVTGNFIGTNAAGTAEASPTSNGFGLRLNGGNNHRIGGPNPADRNLISGNRQGGLFVGLNATNGLLVQGNYIGSDVTGTTQLISVALGQGITIRGAATNASIIGNLISGMPDGGIEDDSTGGAIQGNLIGVQRDEISPLPNANFGGVLLNYGGAGNGGITVGGSGAGQANVIANNSGFGVVVYSNNNLISQNAIYGNSIKDISLNQITNTVLANDACDADATPGNLRQNYPVLSSASVSAGNVTLSGSLDSAASTSFRVEFYANTSCSPSGNGGGRTFLGATTVATNGACTASIGPVMFAVPAGQNVFTATATDPAGNTSEFSACKSISSVTASSTALVSSVNPSNSGQSVTFTATVSGSSPTGTVQFMDGASNLGAPVALGGGIATLTTASLAVGTHSITAAYGGDATNSASTSNTVSQQVVAVGGGTSTALASSLNPSVAGQAVTFTATIAGNNPTGAVQFRDGGANLGAPVAVSAGSAQLTTAALGVGTHSITAIYSGDGANLGSTSPAVLQTVTAVAGRVPTEPIPALSQWALGALALGVAAMAAGRLRRRRDGMR
jgi:CSLREA domain-containing protein